MADKFINETGVATIRDWANGKFATNADLQTLSDEVDEIIAEGGEPNVIETVKVDGTALTPDANKAVNIDLSGKADVADVPTKTSGLTNDGDGTDSNSPFATQAFVAANGGKIDVIKVNGTTQTIANKTVDITVPTKTSDITNDSDFQTGTEVQSAIDTALTSAMDYKGSVATVADLPATDNKKGDFWNVTATGENYAWDGTAWDLCGNIVDASVLWTSQTGQSNSLNAMTIAEINAILEPVTP